MKKVLQSYDTQHIFENEDNDYLTVLAIASRAREIADNYPEFEDLLERFKPTTIALSEFLSDEYHFDYGEK